MVFTIIFSLRLVSGLVQSPVFPGNGRIVASWFPTAERGRASAIFNSSQYFSLVAFGGPFGWLTTYYGWRSCFYFMAIFGWLLAFAWWKLVYNVKEHPLISQSEIDYIERGGGLVNLDSSAVARRNPLTWAMLKLLLSQRMLVGIYIGQFCINTLTTFFLTWFPSYLVKAAPHDDSTGRLRGSVPASCGFSGGILGGIFSDWLLRRGHSLTFARKPPSSPECCSPSP